MGRKKSRPKEPGLHLTWSEEIGDSCPECNGPTVLVTPCGEWDIHEEDGKNGEFVEVREEVSGHYCVACRRLTSLSLNRI